jgi:hypothetical protein
MRQNMRDQCKTHDHLTMALSGMLAGLAGSIEVTGLNYRHELGFSIGYGFDAIAIALLGKSHPLGVVLASILFAAMRNGATRMQFLTQMPVDLDLHASGADPAVRGGGCHRTIYLSNQSSGRTCCADARLGRLGDIMDWKRFGLYPSHHHRSVRRGCFGRSYQIIPHHHHYQHAGNNHRGCHAAHTGRVVGFLL